ncbi:MAG: hypothetical protein IT210_04720 [Armatimonadetes bacterium]|nr:hypothetical protein [Armatimonadota bacterium]
MAKVPDPWTPVEVKGARTNDLSVEVWGRICRFGQGALPTALRTAGEDILAAPLRLAGQTDNGGLEWKESGLKVWERTKEKATLIGWMASDAVTVNLAWRIEYDGMMQVDVTLIPPAQPKAKLTSLCLEVPLKKAFASLYHHWPGQWGSAQNSGAVPEGGMVLPFKPLFWLGWEEGGLSWFAESDRNWQPADAARALEVVPEGDAVVMRLRLLDSPPARMPVSFTFGFQATPVKPLPKDFHEWRICHGASYEINRQKVADGSARTILDRAAELGVKTLIFHEHWTPVQNYWRASEDEEKPLRRLIDDCHKRGIRLLLYFGYELSTLAPEWAAESDKVLTKSPDGSLTGGYSRWPQQRDYIVCLQSEWRDKLVEGMIEAADKYGFDGVYLDGTVEPWGCANEAHGCGYRSIEGRKATYPIFGVRALMSRLYEAMHDKGKLVNAHQSTYCGTPTLGFAHSYWDGEQFMSGELGGDPLQQLPLAAFRAEFMGKNFGVPCEFLVYEQPPKWTADDALAFTLLHDVLVRPGGVGPTLEKISAIWNVFSRFKVSKADWHPYWRNGDLVRADPESVKVSLYRRASGGKTRLLLVVSNLSPTETVSARISLTDKTLPAAFEAADALTGEKLSSSGNGFTVSIPPTRMRLVEVK